MPPEKDTHIAADPPAATVSPKLVDAVPPKNTPDEKDPCILCDAIKDALALKEKAAAAAKVEADVKTESVAPRWLPRWSSPEARHRRMVKA